MNISPFDMPPRRIAVLRALHLGDMLCIVPALRALRASFPDAYITLIGLPWAQSFVERFDEYLDDLLILPGIPGIPEQEADDDSMHAFLQEARGYEFDLAIQLHGSGMYTNSVITQLGAQRVAGFHPEGHVCPDPLTFLPWDEREHEVLRALRLMEHLGMPGEGSVLEFPLYEEDIEALEDCGGDLPVPDTYICIHPGARRPSRRWPAERFAEVADRLARLGHEIVLTGSPEEAGLTAAVRRMMSAPVVDLGGKTSLGALAVLLSRAKLVICNDTSVSQVTAAVGTPSVIVCSGAGSQRWAPLDTDLHRTIAPAVEYGPSIHQARSDEHECALGVGVDEVESMAKDLLNEDLSGGWLNRPMGFLPRNQTRSIAS